MTEKRPMSNAPTPIRIVIADEHPIFRQDLRRLLESEIGLHVVGQASEAHEAVQLTRAIRPDILLLDFALSQRIEPHALNGSAGQFSPVRLVVMVADIEKAHVVEACRFGAHGIILKTSTPRILVKSLRRVMAGQYWLASESVAVLVEALREPLLQVNNTKSPKDYGLTRREVEIINKIASGSSNKEVGEEFSISERTVKHHLTHIFSKVGVSSRLQLALFAVDHLVSHPARTRSLATLHSDDAV